MPLDRALLRTSPRRGTFALLPLVALLAGAASPARSSAEEKAARPIFKLPSKPTKQLIQQALAYGASWTRESNANSGETFELEPDGTAKYAGGSTWSRWECLEPRVRYVISADAIQFACTVAHFSNGGDDDGEGNTPPGGLVSKEQKTFRFQVSLASPDVLILEDPEDRGPRVLTAWTSAGKRMGLGNGEVKGDGAWLVELLAGATDAALYEKVKARLAHAGDEELSPTLVFLEGPKARDPRTTSEIFYADVESRSVAEQVATFLRPVIGPVEVKRWPGAWDYNIVVVVGQAAKEDFPQR